MKIRIKSCTNIWCSSIFYIFAVLYGQILGLFLPVSITKIFVLYLILIAVYGICSNKIKYGWITILSIIIGINFVIRYFLELKEVFTYVYSASIVIFFATLYINNTETISCSLNYKKINRCIWGYLLLNLLLYIAKFSICFQNAGFQMQFKGALPHANMLASVLFSLFLLIFWDKKRLAWCNKVLLTLLVLLSMSRTYILLIFILWLIQIISVLWKKIKFWVKIVLGTPYFAIFGVIVFKIMVIYIPFMSRFQINQFGGNGRQYLQASYVITFKESSLFEKVSGVPLTKSYLNGISVIFNHSFTENSIMGVFLLFGITGLILLIAIFVKSIKDCRSLQGILFFSLCFLSLLAQDTLLSTQTGITMFMSLIIAMYTKDRKKHIELIENNI